jgi:hypothetical protein
MSQLPHCNVPPPWGQTRLHLVTFLEYRLSSQTNTSFSAHFVLTRAHPGKTSRSVTHRSRPSTLNFGFVWRWTFEKEVTTYWYEYPINPVKPWAGMLHPHPLKRLTSSSVNPKPGTSSLGHIRVSSASACAMLCDHSRSTPAMRTMPAQLRHTRPWNRESQLWYHSVTSHLLEARPAYIWSLF